MQLGALIVGTYDSKYTIYDFCVNGSTPLTDTNTYIVGGTWMTNWNTIASTYIAPHFKISEVYSKNSSYSGYRQLKIAVSLLDSLEAVRHYYRADESLTVSCAFRSWGYNKGLSGSWDRSFHMRGRAYDIDSDHHGTTLYSAVYEEFCNGETTPDHSGVRCHTGFGEQKEVWAILRDMRSKRCHATGLRGYICR